MKRALIFGATLFVAAGTCLTAAGQPRGGAAAQNPRAAAPVDLTGYWVAVVNEDWRHRMATPRKGDFESLPLNAEGRRVANEWDLAADDAAGLQCKAFGAGGIMRQPGRLHITWADDDTLQIDFDAGTQTRLLEFAAAQAPAGERTWQGFSRAEWQRPPGGNQGPVRAQIGNSAGPIAPGGGGRGQRGGPPPSSSLTEGGALKVVTTGFRAGYLRKNGVPYSENATVTEYYSLARLRSDYEILVVTTVVEDPAFLTQPFMVSSQFRKQPDAAGWDPSPCSATW
jgi:hypothetical protein